MSMALYLLHIDTFLYIRVHCLTFFKEYEGKDVPHRVISTLHAAVFIHLLGRYIYLSAQSRASGVVFHSAHS